MAERVRFCVIGCGRAGAVHAQNLRFTLPTGDLVTLVDPAFDQAQKLAQELGVRRFFSSLNEALLAAEFDAVIIATPTFTHAQLIVEAAEAGKHVFTEKPLCVDLMEAQRISEALDRAKVKFQVGFMRRFDQSYLRAKELVDRGEIGTPILVKSVGRGPGLPPQWYCDFTKSNGLLAEVNSHDFDSLRWFMGREFKTIFAMAGNFKCPDYAVKYPGFYDTAALLASFEGGGLGMLDGCCPAKYGYDARMEVLGETGMIHIGFENAYSFLLRDGEGRVITQGHSSWRTLFRAAYIAELSHFIDCIVRDEAPKVGLDEGVKALEAVIAANLSIRTGQPVEVRAVREEVLGKIKEVQ